MIFYSTITIKPMCNDHPWDNKIVAVVERWLLFKGHFMINI